MKKLFVFLFLSLPLSVHAQTTDEQAVQQLIQDSFDVLFSGFDSDRMDEFYTEDFLLLEQGEVWDEAVLLEYFSKAKQNPNPASRVNRFEYIKTLVSGDRAWIAYHNFATISRDGAVIREVQWLESATAVKTPSGWRLDMLHSTRMEPK